MRLCFIASVCVTPLLMTDRSATNGPDSTAARPVLVSAPSVAVMPGRVRSVRVIAVDLGSVGSAALGDIDDHD